MTETNQAPPEVPVLAFRKGFEHEPAPDGYQWFRLPERALDLVSALGGGFGAPASVCLMCIECGAFVGDYTKHTASHEASA